jgi:hypothetical protein
LKKFVATEDFRGFVPKPSMLPRGLFRNFLQSGCIWLSPDKEPSESGVMVGSATVTIRSQNDSSVKAIAVSTLDLDLLNACVRLVRLLESPDQYRLIGPLVIREIVYRLLTGEQAHRMRHLTMVGGHAHRMVRAVNKLRELDAIGQASEDDEPSEQAERRRDEIENRLDEIEASETEFTSEQKSQAGVIVTIGHNGKPVYHCGLVERGAKVPSTNGEESSSPEEEKEDLSAALLQDLTTQRTAALRAALSVRPEIALIAITHNLAAQIFYDQTYLLPSSLTVRTDAHADGFDLRAAAESEAAKAIAEQTKDVRNLLPPETRPALGMGARTAPERSLEGPGSGRCSHRQRCPEPTRRRFYRQISCRRRVSSITRSRHGRLVATNRRQLFRPHQEGPNSPSYPRSNRRSRQRKAP